MKNEYRICTEGLGHIFTVILVGNHASVKMNGTVDSVGIDLINAAIEYVKEGKHVFGFSNFTYDVESAEDKQYAYRVAVYGVGESSPSYNSLVFATAQEADTYGRNLASRWSGMDSFKVEWTDKPVTHKILTPYSLVAV